jgi:hypothetical protein
VESRKWRTKEERRKMKVEEGVEDWRKKEEGKKRREERGERNLCVVGPLRSPVRAETGLAAGSDRMLFCLAVDEEQDAGDEGADGGQRAEESRQAHAQALKPNDDQIDAKKNIADKRVPSHENLQRV